MYFERYGRLFLSDVPLLNDRAFLEELLADTGEGERRPGPGVTGAPRYAERPGRPEFGEGEVRP